MTFTPEVRERLWLAPLEQNAKDPYAVEVIARDLRAAMAHIDALEARRNELVASLSTLDAWEKIKLLERAEQAEEREAALEARVAVLAAECRAIRAGKLSIRGNHAQLAEFRRAQQQTDAAGALEGGKP